MYSFLWTTFPSYNSKLYLGSFSSVWTTSWSVSLLLMNLLLLFIWKCLSLFNSWWVLSLDREYGYVTSLSSNSLLKFSTLLFLSLNVFNHKICATVTLSRILQDCCSFLLFLLIFIHVTLRTIYETKQRWMYTSLHRSDICDIFKASE